MRPLNDISELDQTLASNFRLKSRILCVMFGIILAFELVGMAFVLTQTDMVGNVIPVRMVVTGPCLLLTIFLCEFISFRYMGRVAAGERQMRRSFVYLSTFVEVTFPIAVMFIVGNYLRNAGFLTPMEIVSSPLLIVVFIMIILSALLLDPRISYFAGIIGGVEYIGVNVYFLLNEQEAGPIQFANGIAKGVFLVVAGVLAGFVSKKVRDAVVSSLHSKNELINNLDARVAEKTAELEKKNELLEEKQKEILDSIHYAKRIQFTLLPNEKSIIKALNRLTKKQ